jgi:hypothetical protein
MSYHVVVPRFGFKELPDRVLVREDGAYGDRKAHGTPLINYWYVLEQRIPPTEREIISVHLEQLEVDNAKLRELAHLVAEYTSVGQCEGCVAKRACNAGELNMCWIRKAILEKLHELGIEVDT